MKLGAAKNWYSFDAVHSLRLLKSYVDGVEPQIQSSIQDFNKNKGREFIVLSEEQRICEDVEFHRGLDSQSWDLNELFNSYFPNLQRRSAFLTLYTFLEHELEKLCNKLRKEAGLIIGPNDISGNGIYRSLVYMQKVISLNIDENDMPWKEIKEVNKIRNLIVHNDGYRNDHEGKVKKEAKVVDQLSNKYLYWNDDELMIGPEYLSYVLTLFDQLFQYINKAIQVKL